MSAPHILVIEDQEDLASLYEKTLRAAGYKVSNAYSGEEAIAEYEAEGADAIILDMTLPEMSGTQCLEELRKRNARLPVVVVTGERSGALKEHCEQLGVTDYLPKPANYTQILTAIENALTSDEATTGEFELVTLRLPRHIVKSLKDTDTRLERAITRWHDERRHISLQPPIVTAPPYIESPPATVLDTSPDGTPPKTSVRRSLLDSFKRRFRLRR